MGAAQSPLLGAAMFAPAVLYILLLVGGPFLLAIFYAFSDARIGNAEMHFVGWKTSAAPAKPQFSVAIRNSFIFTICSKSCDRRRQHSRHLPGKNLPRPRLIRF